MRISKGQLEKIISEELQKELKILDRAVQRGLAPTKGLSTPPATEEPAEEPAEEPEPEPEPEPEVEEAPDILAAVEEPQVEKYRKIINSANKDNFKKILEKIKLDHLPEIYDILESAILKNIFKEQYGQRLNNTTTVGSMNKTIEDISKLINDGDKKDNYWGQKKPFSIFIADKIKEKGQEKGQEWSPISEDNWRIFLQKAFPNIFNYNYDAYMNNVIFPMFDVIKQDYPNIVSPPARMERKIYNRWKLIAGIK